MNAEKSFLKDLFIGSAQVIVFFLLYEIVVFLVRLIATLLLYFISLLPIVGNINSVLMSEGILYTFCPILSGFVIVALMKMIFKKGLFLISSILMFMLVSYEIISYIIRTAISSSIISWDMANAIWYSTILCGIIFYGLYHQLRSKIKFENDSQV